jgi:flagellar biosynthesis protein FlhG
VDQAANLRRLVLENNLVKKTRTIAITSGKGGVGKSSMAVSLSIALARNNMSVTLLDADLGLANINVILGIIPKFNLYHVIKGKKKLKDIVIEVPEGIKIIAGASGFHQLANLEDKQRSDFIESVSDLDADDFMIIDTGAGVSQNVLGFVLAADEVIVVTTPEPTAITDAYGIIKSIASQTPEKSIKLIVNRVQSVSEGKRVAQRVISIAGQFLNIKVDNLGFVYRQLSQVKGFDMRINHRRQDIQQGSRC